jgi:hypothetical protein
MKQMGLEIIPSDIIPIVNYAWSGSFDNVDTNIKVILERGWCPLNRMLLLHPEIRKTMTAKDIEEEEEEEESGLFSKKTSSSSSLSNTNKLSLQLPTMHTDTFNTQPINISNNKTSHLQFTGQTASCCLQKIVQEHDFERAREQIIEDKKTGEVLRE